MHYRLLSYDESYFYCLQSAILAVFSRSAIWDPVECNMRSRRMQYEIRQKCNINFLQSTQKQTWPPVKITVDKRVWNQFSRGQIINSLEDKINSLGNKIINSLENTRKLLLFWHSNNTTGEIMHCEGKQNTK